MVLVLRWSSRSSNTFSLRPMSLGLWVSGSRRLANGLSLDCPSLCKSTDQSDSSFLRAPLSCPIENERERKKRLVVFVLMMLSIVLCLWWLIWSLFSLLSPSPSLHFPQPASSGFLQQSFASHYVVFFFFFVVVLPPCIHLHPLVVLVLVVFLGFGFTNSIAFLLRLSFRSLRFALSFGPINFPLGPLFCASCRSSPDLITEQQDEHLPRPPSPSSWHTKHQTASHTPSHRTAGWGRSSCFHDDSIVCWIIYSSRASLSGGSLPLSKIPAHSIVPSR